VRYDGLWVLRTNTVYNAETVAHVYKALWTVEDIIRTTKSIMDTRPIYHRCNEIIRGHVFCSFLALLLKTELERRMKFADLKCEWAQVIRDLEAFATGRGDFSGEKLCSTEPDYQRGLQHLKNVSGYKLGIYKSDKTLWHYIFAELSV
jgi:hypothetical protein